MVVRKTLRHLISASTVVAVLFTSGALAQATVRLVPERQPGCAGKPCSRPAIVFVHGIWGDEDTWKGSGAARSWPQLVAEDPAFNNADIFRIDYHTAFISSNGQASGPRIAGEVYAAIRRPLEHYQRIYFIAHSMGGNVVRDYLVTLKSSTPSAKIEGTPPRLVGGPHEAMRPYTYGLFFLGTPSEGAGIAQLGKLVSNDPALRTLVPLDINDYLQLLNRTWGSANGREMSIDERTIEVKKKPFGVTGRTFLSTGRRLQIFSVCETKPLKIAGVPTLIVVPRESATAMSNASESQCFDRDHSTLVKPLDRSDEVYIWVMSKIQKAEEQAPTQ